MRKNKFLTGVMSLFLALSITVTNVEAKPSSGSVSRPSSPKPSSSPSKGSSSSTSKTPSTSSNSNPKVNNNTNNSSSTNSNNSSSNNKTYFIPFSINNSKTNNSTTESSLNKENKQEIKKQKTKFNWKNVLKIMLLITLIAVAGFLFYLYKRR